MTKRPSASSSEELWNRARRSIRGSINGLGQSAPALFLKSSSSVGESSLSSPEGLEPAARGSPRSRADTPMSPMSGSAGSLLPSEDDLESPREGAGRSSETPCIPAAGGAPAEAGGAALLQSHRASSDERAHPLYRKSSNKQAGRAPRTRQRLKALVTSVRPRANARGKTAPARHLELAGVV